MTDSQVGRTALAYFYDAWGGNSEIEFDDFLDYYATPMTPDFGLVMGRTIRVSETPDETVHAAMLHLAASAPMGKIPKASIFVNAIADPYINPDWMTYIKRKAVQVEESVVEGVKDTAKVAGGVIAGGAAIYGLWIVGGLILASYLGKAAKA